MNSNQIENIVDAALAHFSSESIKPTEIAKIINAVLQVAEVEKDGEVYQINPQMMYNYSAKGMIVKGSPRSAKGNGIEARYTSDEVRAFAIKFITKQGDKVETGNLADSIREMLTGSTEQVDQDA